MIDRDRHEPQYVPVFQDILDRVQSAATVEEVEKACLDFAGAAGFTTWIYTVFAAFSSKPSYNRIRGNHDPEWHARYIDNDYAAVDPALRRLREGRVRPMIWYELDFDCDPDPDAVRAYARDAAAYGMTSGITFPVRGPSGEIAALHLASPEDGCVTGPRAICAMPYGQLLADYVHEAMERLTAETAGEQASISERQRDCLFWAAEGKTTEEIGQIMDVKPSTVACYLAEAQRRLGAKNRMEAVARGMTAGLINGRYGQPVSGHHAQPARAAAMH